MARRPHPASRSRTRSKTAEATHARKLRAEKNTAARGKPRKPAPASSPASGRKGRIYAPARRLPLADSNRRLKLLIGAVMVVSLGFSLRLVQVQALDTDSWATAAENQILAKTDLPAHRGTITDRNGRVLAGSEDTVTVTCDPQVVAGDPNRPQDIKNAPARTSKIAELLAKHLGGSASDYRPLLVREKTRYVVLKRNVPSAVFRALAVEMNEHGLYGIFVEHGTTRTYPAGSLASNVVGFVNADGEGKAGLEQWYDQQLKGAAGSMTSERSVYGHVPLGVNKVTEPVDGHTITTTIDADLQASWEMALRNAVRSHGPQARGWIVAMDVRTGEVLVNAQYPTFDPGHLDKASPDALGSFAAAGALEPGSVHKVLTFASLVEEGLVVPDTRVIVPPKLMSGGAAITDEQAHGTVHLTARGVLARSSNIGTSLLARKVTRETLLKHYRNFGLGQRTGVQVPGEAAGILSPTMTEAQLDRAAFGQSLSVNAIQLTAAVAGIANGGVYHPPTLVKTVTDAQDNEIHVDDRTPRRIVSKETSDKVLNMMEGVVRLGEGTYDVPGYRLAGKTGTAERFEPACGCYRGNTVSYVAVAPVERPVLAVYMAIDKPSGRPSGGRQVAPIVTELMKTALPRYGVPMSTTPGRKDPLTW